MDLQSQLTDKRISIRAMTVALVVFTMAVTALVAISLQYYFSRQMAQNAAIKSYQTSAQNIGSFVQSIESRGIQIAQVLARFPELVNSVNHSTATRDVFAEVMNNNPVFYSVYLGFDNGDFYGLVNLESSPGIRIRLKAGPDDRWVVNTVRETENGRTRTLYFYDENFRLRDVHSEPSRYDVRERPWYAVAREGEVASSPPYLFQFNQVTGKTFSIRVPGNNVVVALDVTLQSFSNYLLDHQVDDKSKIYVFNRTGHLIASNHLPEPSKQQFVTPPLVLNDAQRRYVQSLGTLRVSNDTDWPPLDYTVAGQPQGYLVDLMHILAASLGLEIEHINGYRWPELIAKFNGGELDLLQSVIASEQALGRGPLTQPLLQLPFSIAVARGAAPISSLQGLKGKSVAVVEGWGPVKKLQRTAFGVKIVEVATPLESLQVVADGFADAAIDFTAVLQSVSRDYFFDDVVVGDAFYPAQGILPDNLHLQVRPEYEELIPLLNMALDNIAPQDRQLLHDKWLDPSVRPGVGHLAVVPYREFLEAARNESLQGQLRRVRLDGKDKFLYVDNILPLDEVGGYIAVLTPAEAVLGESHRQLQYSVLITAAVLLLLLPLAWFSSTPLVRPIEALRQRSDQVRLRQYQNIEPFPSKVKELDSLSGSMVEMAQSIRQHEQQQKDLLDSFIQIIANAIDEKSPYTGEHCERVPEIGLMLARAAHESEDPPFAGFRFNDTQWREFRIAAWLHDCGKITTPEHIVDKGTKLETIYNRIHEIRMRFEVLWRDAYIEFLEQREQYPEKEAELELVLARKQKKLQEDFSFVASLNQGSESTAEGVSEKLTELSQLTWRRYFNDRLGLSPVEEGRLQGDVAPLPAVEPLLADKPEHIIQRERRPDYPAHLGITMTPPEHLYNRGEIYNLSIRYGTLTAEDRFKINEHIIATIKMLDGLPFPPELANVPRYASTHHESMDGGGYPRGLSAKDLSIPDRILVVADIFEALTAGDRPYKKAKTLSEAIAILAKMADKGHVDKEIFHLLLKSGAYLQYAQQFLLQSQLDNVDVEQYLS
ncbi:HD domain-containing phosphohydrolase [Gilvimarinus sp. DA14]|uniref:HD domain-containing phosphohydrolase n=1 Tax=Gilvimarinus sp. DA14 TaxID=2956798 RepID=UPI0020B72CC4|nr:HD domain-containing phosphohydrolase [Gilvimarinus sp. DA14]UTF60593.1 transporter substrate-binding domain-containing protein [Gilvimarinus sp. DA14]